MKRWFIMFIILIGFMMWLWGGYYIMRQLERKGPPAKLNVMLGGVDAEMDKKD